MYTELAILALFIFIYSLVAGRVERSVISGPMVFVIVGFLIGPSGIGWLKGDATSVGSWTVKRVASTMVYGCGVNPKGSMTVTSGEPLLGKSVTFAVHDPGASMPMGAR